MAQAQPRLHLRHFQRFFRQASLVGEENIARNPWRARSWSVFVASTITCDYGLQRTEACCCATCPTLSNLQPVGAGRLSHPEVEDLLASLGGWCARLIQPARGMGRVACPEWSGRAAGACPSRTAGDPAADPRAFAARIRAELHRLLGALAAATGTSPVRLRDNPSSDTPEWTAERLAADLAPYFQEHASIMVTPAARSPHNTLLTPIGVRLWEAQQRLVDPRRRGLCHSRARRPFAALHPVRKRALVELLRVGR